MNVPYPNLNYPYTHPLFSQTYRCGIDYVDLYKQDCIYFHDEIDMGAHIYMCTHTIDKDIQYLDNSSCKNCKYYETIQSLLQFKKEHTLTNS